MAAKRARVGFAPTSTAARGGPQTKYFDTGIAANITTAGTDWSNTEVACETYVNSSGTPAAYTDSALIPSAVGTGYGEVNGNRYYIKRVRVRGFVSKANLSGTNSVASPVKYRLVLVLDQSPNGVQAQGEDVIQDFGNAGANCCAFAKTAAGPFRLLKEWTGELHVTGVVNNASAGTCSMCYSVDDFMLQWQPRVPLEVNISSGGTTPAIGQLQSANVFLLAYGIDESDGAIPLTVTAAARCYYLDP